ncbi:MAG: hypothetical protein P4L27_04380 [Ignavibacteriaceae bacterium]|nr:hypothetical protein [Ignavibacteriaceae bacterium]
MSTLKFTVWFLFFSSFLLAQNVSVSDYNVPISTAKILRLNGTYNWSQSSNDTLTVVTANNAAATLTLRSFYSSLPFAWFFDVDATGGKSFSDWTHDISLRPSIRKYVWDDQDWFGFAAFDMRHANTFKQIESNLQLGGGYGRYINATALAKAVRIEEHLLNEGVIKDHMPKETMIKIANIIERESEFQGVYGATYEKQWYEAIEQEIKASGLLVGDALGAIGLLRTQQVLKGINEIVNPRYYGWDLNLGVSFNLSKRDKSPTNSPALTVSGRFSNPIGWRAQIDAFASVGTPIDSTFFNQVITTAGINYLYELSNRINFVASYNLNYTAPAAGTAYADHNLTGSFVFYLENYINLGINATMVRNGQTKETDLNSSVTLQYNFF